ncbi:FeoA family protein [Helicobacter winghamensis]|uniref:Iron transporter FeoA n=1 Tax=Helicobacter winghamensis TaxID=157268 RepID=A0A2N3PKY9_9HELI|nr:FeoA family protein [Helicobacter winghamensis]EEO26774.1 FeoA domain protein [Helicobacter winghamensis ATCC BAA-430]PKT79123.1 iron transporter FeoA [Helicobacter winghamensis]PKT79187.1 iron transporter FeoA [Helicobacter winghamensis]PKT79275.1 iron transporter FeoA [Helicobacter winghamensis]PKT82341.1 iron transporter FeoA [Helicobacter winghamensis]
MCLNDCKVGDKVTIKTINLKGEIFQKLLDMGFVPGATLEIRKHSLLNDPIQIKIHNYLVAIRSNEARAIEVK